MLHRFTLACLASLSGFFVLVRAADEPSPQPEFSAENIEFFESKIRPVLVEECYECHSTRSATVEAGLTLDSRAALIEGGDSGAVIAPGSPEESLLIQAISYRSETLAMPPQRKLTAEVQRDFATWVRLGAPWPPGETPSTRADAAAWDWPTIREAHWAWRPVAQPEPPPVRDQDWPRSELDHFVLARLEASGLTPAPAVDRRTLIRRAYFDLLGLPPTPREVDAFLVDTSDRAFEKVIDRLLADAAYGERWGRHWLDVARYSDGFGAFSDQRPREFAYRFRDWVTEALALDTPYDLFVKYQIAGDLIAGGEHAAATGFFALGPTYRSDGGAPESVAQARAETLDDRVDTLSRGFMALTVSCARCHDHKFDPVPTQDYYSLAGVFNNSKEFDKPTAPEEVVQRYDDAQAAIRAAEQKRRDRSNALRRREEKRLQRRVGIYVNAALAFVLKYGTSASPEGRSAYAADNDLVGQVLDRWVGFLSTPNNRGRLPRLDPLFDALHSSAQPSTSGDDRQSLDPDLAEAIDAFESNVVRLLERQEAQRRDQKSTGEGPKNEAEASDTESKVLFEIIDPLCSLNRAFRNLLNETERQELDDLLARRTQLEENAPPKYPVLHTIADSGSADMRVALRGNPLKFGELAPRRFLRLIAGDAPQLFTRGSGRLDLADAVARADNPLTARVIVNRAWLHHFGRALVRSPSNFGTLGERPTHPLLLDWLATKLIQNGWSLKAFHRAVMLSATYRMSSDFDADHFARDGDNRLVWRTNPRRLDVEAWRDSVLAVTATLDRRLGGQPTQELLEGRRRTLYSIVSRNQDRFESDAFLLLFDFPSPRITSARRTVSTVPQQFLFLLNSEFMVNSAKKLAAQLVASSETDSARINTAYALLFARQPSAAERHAALEFLQTTPAQSSTAPVSAPTAPERAANSRPAGLTLWEQYAQVLLSSHEFRSVR